MRVRLAVAAAAASASEALELLPSTPLPLDSPAVVMRDGVRWKDDAVPVRRETDKSDLCRNSPVAADAEAPSTAATGIGARGPAAAGTAPLCNVWARVSRITCCPALPSERIMSDGGMVSAEAAAVENTGGGTTPSLRAASGSDEGERSCAGIADNSALRAARGGKLRGAARAGDLLATNAP